MKQQESKQVVAVNHEALQQENEWQVPIHLQEQLKNNCVKID